MSAYNSAYNQESVLEVRHWTDTLFSFRTTRDPAFRFENGQFTMVGLVVDGRPLVRAYSMASANYDEGLEFFSIKVPNGPLTSRLQHLQVGDNVLIGRKPVGTLLLDNLTLPGRNLYLFGTGTGLAPFASLVRDPQAYERFDRVVLVHGCRMVAELAYGEDVVRRLMEDEYVGELAREKLLHYPTATREPFRHRGRIPELVDSGRIFEDLGLPRMSHEDGDRAMLCGSPQMLEDCRKMLEARGFTEGSSNKPATYVIEKAFVEK